MQFDTDKYKHGLISRYEVFFAPLKDRKLKILEIGIFRGGSLLWLVDYFKNAEILGLDLEIPDIHHERITMSVCDQNDSGRLCKMGLRHGPFDIIIDDGSHRYKETKITFDCLYGGFLNKGGLYIIEDFIAGYWLDQPEYKNLHNLVFDIAARKNELGINQFNIFLQDPKCSMACFVKK